VNFRIATVAQNAVANQLRSLIDANGGAGTINFYDGTQPAIPNTPVSTQKLLATLTFSNPSFGGASGGTITAGTIVAQNALRSGAATWARISDAAGNTVCDCDVGTTGATINLNTTAIVANGPVVVTVFTVSVPSG
jgi:hypothetical protein